MSSPLLQALDQHVAAATKQNLTADRAPALAPPLIAAESPLLELLINDLRATVPRELQTQLCRASSLSAALDWLAASALYRWVEAKPITARAYLNQLGHDPRRAGLALATGIAAQMEPPPQTPHWRRLDRVGLVLQLTIATLILAGRGTLFWLLAVLCGSGIDPRVTSFVSIMMGQQLLATTSSVSGAMLAGCTAIIWLALEAVLGPIVMERSRQLPARGDGLAPPVSWRQDTFYVVWWIQSGGVLVSVTVAMLARIAWACSR
jgi:hypothetical protein